MSLVIMVDWEVWSMMFMSVDRYCVSLRIGFVGCFIFGVSCVWEGGSLSKWVMVMMNGDYVFVGCDG